MRSDIRRQEIVALTLTGCFLVIFILIAFLKKGTGDSGDSIEHYLISRFSFAHPELFLHHWGKPVFTLLSSPFSQFGFTGIKIFNCLVASTTGYFTYKTASRLHINHSPLVLFLLFSAPVYFKYIFSGMTEHLMGLALIVSVYLMLKNKITLSLLIVSFMPFMRSEGLILMGVFAFYLLVKRKFRYLPLLLTGHVWYSIVGYFHYHDFFWIFNRIPYLNLDSWYGSGQWQDFVSKLYYVVGLPLFTIFLIGMGWIVVSFVKKDHPYRHEKYPEEMILVYGSFAAFFVAHSLFWALGIFNSMGLGRVLNSVIPLTAIIGMRGLEWISSTKYQRLNQVILHGMILFILVFPFIGNPASLKWHKDLDLTTDQQLIDEVIPELKNLSPGTLLLYSHPYIGMQAGIDPFDPKQRGKIQRIKDPGQLPLQTIIVWDSWFSPTEEGYTPEMLSSLDFLMMASIKTSKADPGKKIAIFVLKEADNR